MGIRKIAVFGALVLAFGAGAGFGRISLPRDPGLPTFSHIFLIIMENAGYNQIIDSPDAPYLNRLADRYALATRYVAIDHPSVSNYLALFAGDTFTGTTINDNCTPAPSTCSTNAPNLADQIEASGRTWKEYQENMPSACFPKYSSPDGLYVVRHQPALYFNQIRENAVRCANVVPYTQLATDLARGTVPNFSWITPNLCDDMHNCAVRSGDAWLARNVPLILASAAFRNGGVLFITWDEDDFTPVNQVATLVVSPYAIPGFRSSVLENHYNLLRTIEAAWSLPPIGGAVGKMPMREYFR
jgi:phosphatidylinositol-3-phosphatase